MGDEIVRHMSETVMHNAMKSMVQNEEGTKVVKTLLSTMIQGQAFAEKVKHDLASGADFGVVIQDFLQFLGTPDMRKVTGILYDLSLNPQKTRFSSA